MTWQLPRHVAHPTTVAISVSQLEQNTTLSPIFIKTSKDEQTTLIWTQQRQQTITCFQDFQQITWTSELRFCSQDSWNPNKKN
jgi:type III secretory pathway component EscU